MIAFPFQGSEAQGFRAGGRLDEIENEGRKRFLRGG